MFRIGTPVEFFIYDKKYYGFISDAQYNFEHYTIFVETKTAIYKFYSDDMHLTQINARLESIKYYGQQNPIHVKMNVIISERTYRFWCC